VVILNNMSFLISHIVFAKKAFASSLIKKEEQKFLIGTTFPDIRYLAGIDRERTHLKDMSLERIQNEKNSFLAGLKFHNLIDDTRDEFIRERSGYDLIPNAVKDKISSLKIAEDVVLYHVNKDWQNDASFFDNILSKEKEFSIGESQLISWHKVVAAYISQQPSPKSTTTAIVGLGFSEKQAKKIVYDAFKITEVKGAQSLILSFYNNLEERLTRQKPDKV